jgi:hypothetical protein
VELVHQVHAGPLTEVVLEAVLAQHERFLWNVRDDDDIVHRAAVTLYTRYSDSHVRSIQCSTACWPRVSVSHNTVDAAWRIGHLPDMGLTNVNNTRCLYIVAWNVPTPVSCLTCLVLQGLTTP